MGLVMGTHLRGGRPELGMGESYLVVTTWWLGEGCKVFPLSHATGEGKEVEESSNPESSDPRPPQNLKLRPELVVGVLIESESPIFDHLTVAPAHHLASVSVEFLVSAGGRQFEKRDGAITVP